MKMLRNIRLIATPDLFLEPFKSEAHFYETISYIKPIELFAPYHRSYHAAKAAGRVEAFHQEVREFFYALPKEAADYQLRRDRKTGKHRWMLVTRRRFLYGGNCHGSSAHPLGLKPAVRGTEAHKEAIREKVSAAREAEARCREDEDNPPME